MGRRGFIQGKKASKPLQWSKRTFFSFLTHFEALLWQCKLRHFLPPLSQHAIHFNPANKGD
jgi:hypothetical protein